MADDASYGSRRDLVNRRRGGASSTTDSQRSGQAMYQPGQPIGYLAARGTVYEKKYFTKKLGFCCLFIAPPVILVVLAITLVPVLYAVAQHVIHTAQLKVESANITSPGNASFPLVLRGKATKTGIFPAHLYFRKPVDVYWRAPPEDGLTEFHLGQLSLAHIGTTSRGTGTINQATTFNIIDQAGFGRFAQWLVTQEEFTWRLNCPEIHAEAFGFFPPYKQFEFTKDVVIKGINNFPEINILDLQLPGDDPAGGITVNAVARLVNPSPFGVQVGTLNLDLFYKNMYLGPVSSNNLNLTAGPNTVAIRGRLIPHANNQTELELLGELFTNYINGAVSPVVGRGVSTQLANGDTVGWLSQGIKALEANIPFKSPTPIDPIKGIAINYLSLVFNQTMPYNPTVFSNDLQGTFALPFGFSLNISQLATQLNILFMGAPVGTVDGPYSESNTNITVLSTGQTAGTIALTLAPSTIILPNTTEAARKQLVAFQNAFTFSDAAGFDVTGSARAITDTPLGRVLLNGIKFNVTTGLAGLSGLNKYPTVIQSVDVLGGRSDAVNLGVGLALVNPSNLNLTVGDATFNLINGVALGNATIPNLNLRIGENRVNSTANFDPNRDPRGLETLNRFISGLSTNLNISGFPGSSPIESLDQTFQGVKINATLPGLQTRLVQTANLTVLDSTGVTDDIAIGHVALNNPFTSPLKITQIAANASSYGVYLANINTPLNFNAAGKGVSISPDVPLNVNLFPPDLFAIVREFVIESKQDPKYLDGVLALGGFTLTPTVRAAPSKRGLSEQDKDSFVFEDDSTMAQVLMGAATNPGATADMGAAAAQGGVETDTQGEDDEEDEESFAKRALPLPYHGMEKRANLYTGFSLVDYIGKAFDAGTADLVISSKATIGDYSTTLTFAQNAVPLGYDNTLFKLLPILALPIVQKVVDGAILNIDRVTVLEPRPTSFRASLQGALTNAGPFDAIVSFPAGLDIYYQGRLLTTAAFPNVTLVGDLGSQINVELEGQIGDVDFFTQFLRDALLNPSFIWNIRARDISVAALGININGITLNKDVQLTGFNGLRDQIIINSFDVPANDPAGGITLTAIATINNPSQVGVSLSRFGTLIYGNNSLVGPAAAANPFTLQALAVTQLPLAGRIVPQTDQAGLDTLGNVFTNFVHGQNTPLQARGDYAGPPEVAWLNNGIKALNAVIQLPAQNFQVIRTVSINQLSLFFTVATAYNPPASSSNTTANFFLPFSLPIDIKQVQGPFTAVYQNTDMAVLNIPQSNSLTDVEARVLTIIFNNVPFAVFNNARQTFNQFVADVTARDVVTFGLKGQATGTVATGAGTIVIRDIPFDLQTNILGLQNLNARPANVSNLDVVRGYPTYLLITVDTTLYNPSDITIGAGDIQFGAIFNGRMIGTAQIKNVVLVPGTNVVATQILYSPQGADNVAAGQLLLENYVQNITSRVTVQGNSMTTPIPSLLQGLSGIALQADIPPLMKLIVTSAYLEIPADIAQRGIALASVDIANPFTASINLIRLRAQAVYQGILLGTIDQDLTNNPIRAPGKATTRSQQIQLNLTTDPKTLIRFILAAAAAANVDLGPYPPLFQEVLNLPDTTTTVVPTPDPNPTGCVSGRAFDLLGAVLRLLKPLATTINVQATALIDDYQTNLNFVQQPVPTITDNTALYLVGPAGAPLIQLLVNQAVLSVSLANATRIDNSGFDVSLQGSLTLNLPADALVELPDGLDVFFQGNLIANIALPPICATPPNGVPDLRLSGRLTIRDQGRFTDFAEFLLKQPNFQWRLTSRTVVGRALGIRFSNTILDKTIQLDAFNGLPGLVISRFAAPSQGPGARINLAVELPIPSPASLGVELGAATFDAYFRGTFIGPITTRNLFLAAKTTTVAQIDGYIVRQTGQGLVNLGILFSQYLAPVNSTLEARGNQVVTPASNGQPVQWLTNAFKRFSTNAILPGMRYDILKSITISDITAEILEPSNSYSVVASSNRTLATFANPFNFDLTALQAAANIDIAFNNVAAANLVLPLRNVVSSDTSSGPDDIAQLVLDIRRQRLNAIDRGGFEQFFRAVTDTPNVDFRVSGSVDVVAQTVVGNPRITGIPFNLPSALKGINSFDRTAVVSNVNVDNPTPQFLGIRARATLNNPSQVTVVTNRVLLPLLYQGQEFARASIDPALFIPGQNVLGTLVQVPTNNNTATEEVIRQYLEPTDKQTSRRAYQVPVQIKGRPGANPPLSPYPSLEPALADVSIDATLPGLATVLINQVRAYLSLDAVLAGIGSLLFDNPADPLYAYAYIDATNELPVNLRLTSISATIFGTTEPTGAPYAIVTNPLNFPIQRAPATAVKGPRATSPEVRNIRLTRGLLGSLGLLIQNANLDAWITADVSAASGTTTGLPIHYGQNNIDTVVLLGLGTGDIGIPISPLLKTLADLVRWLLGVLTGADLQKAQTQITQQVAQAANQKKLPVNNDIQDALRVISSLIPPEIKTPLCQIDQQFLPFLDLPTEICPNLASSSTANATSTRPANGTVINVSPLAATSTPPPPASSTVAPPPASSSPAPAPASSAPASSRPPAGASRRAVPLDAHEL